MSDLVPPFVLAQLFVYGQICELGLWDNGGPFFCLPINLLLLDGKRGSREGASEGGSVRIITFIAWSLTSLQCDV